MIRNNSRIPVDFRVLVLSLSKCVNLEAVQICGGEYADTGDCNVVSSVELAFAIIMGLILPFIIIAGCLAFKSFRAHESICSGAGDTGSLPMFQQFGQPNNAQNHEQGPYAVPSQIIAIANTSQKAHELILDSALHDKTSTDDYKLLIQTGYSLDSVRLQSITARVTWNDQGWGNQKGQILIRLTRTLALGREETIGEQDLFGIAPHDQQDAVATLSEQHANFKENILDKQKFGDVISVWYKVGGGGGHSLHVKSFHLSLEVEDADSSAEVGPVLQGIEDADSSAEDEWTCSTCTFAGNKALALSCSVCGTEKSDS